MTGFKVDLDALDNYSRQLADNKSSVTRVAGLVNQADVGDRSWGIVGLFVEHSYTEMLGDLKELMTELENGVQSASDKTGAAAQRYRSADEETLRFLTEIVKGLDGTVNHQSNV